MESPTLGKKGVLHFSVLTAKTVIFHSEWRPQEGGPHHFWEMRLLWKDVHLDKLMREEKDSDVKWPDGRKDIWRNEEVDRTDWYEDKASDLHDSRIYRVKTSSVSIANDYQAWIKTGLLDEWKSYKDPLPVLQCPQILNSSFAQHNLHEKNWRHKDTVVRLNAHPPAK